VALGVGARPTALEVYGPWLLWADASASALRRCRLPACRSPELLLNGTGIHLRFSNCHIAF
jgi:hypothetical protein